MLVESMTPLQMEMMKRAHRGDLLARLFFAPWEGMETPDSWQKELLSSLVTNQRNVICNCSRQSGKTTVTSLAALILACTGKFVLVVSASDRQAMEFMRRLKRHHARLNLAQAIRDNDHEMDFQGGGKVLALPKSEGTIRGFSAVDLLVIDEAAKVPDAIYNAVRPMLIVSRGQTALLSSPDGRRGFFYEEWQGKGDWQRFRIPWNMCPRIKPTDIEAERQRPGVIVEQEYLDCGPGEEFLATSGAVFDTQCWQDLLDNNFGE